MKNSMCIALAVLVCATFAAPARGQRLLERIAQPLLEQLEDRLQQQAVTRSIAAEDFAGQQGYLGIIANDDLEDGHGVRVLSLRATGPADGAGMRSGDLIVSVGGNAVRNMQDLADLLRKTTPGEQLDVEVSRNGQRVTLDVTLGHLVGLSSPLEGHPRARLGVEVTPVTEEVRRNHRLLVRRGAFIESVDPSSPADRSGLPVGAVIVNFNSHRVDTPQDLVDLIRAVGSRTVVEIAYVHHGRVSSKSLQLAPVAATLTPPIRSEPLAAPAPTLGAEPGEGVENLFPPLPPTPAAAPSLEELENRLDDAMQPPADADAMEQRIDALERQVSQILDQLDKTSNELVQLRELLQQENEE